MNHLYKVTITRFVVAPDETRARELALANNNPLDVETVEKPETLADIPQNWRNCQPYGGAFAASVEQHLVHQIARTPEYTEFCVQPFKVGADGNVEITTPYDPRAEYGVYARYGSGLAMHLADFQSQLQAETFKRRIERARRMQRNAIVPAPDAHLEAQYEDQVCGLVEA